MHPSLPASARAALCLPFPLLPAWSGAASSGHREGPGCVAGGHIPVLCSMQTIALMRYMLPRGYEVDTNQLCLLFHTELSYSPFVSFLMCSTGLRHKALRRKEKSLLRIYIAILIKHFCLHFLIP